MNYNADNKNKLEDDIEFLPEITEPNTHIIKHIVISGGGTTGLSYYGILRESQKKNIWNIKDIQTIYGTSIGSILAVMLCLKYDWDTLDDYLIKRPWQNVFHYDINTLLSCVQNNGIFSKKLTEKIFSPLLLGKDIPLTITINDFFKLTNIELHIIVTNVNIFEPVDISYKTHPDWLLLDAIHASSSIPLIFTPILLNGQLYCDGGFCINYPVKLCIDNGANPNEIIGIKTLTKNNEEANVNDFSLFDYIIYLLNKILNKLIYTVEHKIRYTFLLPFDHRSLSNISTVAEKQTDREELIENGKKVFQEQYENLDIE